MNAKLIVQGKEFDIEILDPELQKLIRPKKTGYERVELNEYYYYVDCAGKICEVKKYTTDSDDMFHAADNCYSDRKVAENNARADKLMRHLRRFAVKHRDKDVNWRTNYNLFEVWYDYQTYKIKIEEVWSERSFGSIVFDSEETAQLAIDTFRDELIWYFTEYKDSL